MRVNAGAWLCLLGGNQIWGADLKTISRVSIHNPVSGERMKLKQVGDEAPLFMSVLGPVGVVDTPTAFYRLAVVQRRGKKNN